MGEDRKEEAEIIEIFKVKKDGITHTVQVVNYGDNSFVKIANDKPVSQTITSTAENPTIIFKGNESGSQGKTFETFRGKSRIQLAAEVLVLFEEEKRKEIIDKIDNTIHPTTPGNFIDVMSLWITYTLSQNTAFDDEVSSDNEDDKVEKDTPVKNDDNSTMGEDNIKRGMHPAVKYSLYALATVAVLSSPFFYLAITKYTNSVNMPFSEAATLALQDISKSFVSIAGSMFGTSASHALGSVGSAIVGVGVIIAVALLLYGLCKLATSKSAKTFAGKAKIKFNAWMQKKNDKADYQYLVEQ
ncbi:MAG: hypothetical protein COB50_01020 [Thiotrichales bacterium]|nr:MAG: hypothetical protein COB50_01020 [Thiotrichales bacterium]